MLVQKLEMGYCPNCVVTKGLGSWALGAGRRHARHGVGRAGGGAQGSRARSTRARSAGGRTGGGAGRAIGARGTRGTQAWARPGHNLGVLLGQWAVHLVHSACFDLV